MPWRTPWLAIAASRACENALNSANIAAAAAIAATRTVVSEAAVLLNAMAAMAPPLACLAASPPQATGKGASSSISYPQLPTADAASGADAARVAATGAFDHVRVPDQWAIGFEMGKGGRT